MPFDWSTGRDSPPAPEGDAPAQPAAAESRPAASSPSAATPSTAIVRGDIAAAIKEAEENLAPAKVQFAKLYFSANFTMATEAARRCGYTYPKEEGKRLRKDAAVIRLLDLYRQRGGQVAVDPADAVATTPQPRTVRAAGKVVIPTAVIEAHVIDIMRTSPLDFFEPREDDARKLQPRPFDQIPEHARRGIKSIRMTKDGTFTVECFDKVSLLRPYARPPQETPAGWRPMIDDDDAPLDPSPEESAEPAEAANLPTELEQRYGLYGGAPIDNIRRDLYGSASKTDERRSRA